MTAQPSLFPAGELWIVRVPMTGPAYWFTSAREATAFFNSHHPVTSNSIFPAVNGLESMPGISQGDVNRPLPRHVKDGASSPQGDQCALIMD